MAGSILNHIKNLSHNGWRMRSGRLEPQANAAVFRAVIRQDEERRGPARAMPERSAIRLVMRWFFPQSLGTPAAQIRLRLSLLPYQAIIKSQIFIRNLNIRLRPSFRVRPVR